MNLAMNNGMLRDTLHADVDVYGSSNDAAGVQPQSGAIRQNGSSSSVDVQISPTDNQQSALHNVLYHGGATTVAPNHVSAIAADRSNSTSSSGSGRITPSAGVSPSAVRRANDTSSSQSIVSPTAALSLKTSPSLPCVDGNDLLSAQSAAAAATMGGLIPHPMSQHPMSMSSVPSIDSLTSSLTNHQVASAGFGSAAQWQQRLENVNGFGAAAASHHHQAQLFNYPTMRPDLINLQHFRQQAATAAAAHHQHHHVGAGGGVSPAIHHHSGLRPMAGRNHCKVCGRGFDSKAELQIHNQTHMRETKPYRCLTCGKAFANSSYLSQHARIHAGTRPFGPCTYCHKKFTQLSHLQQHIRTHTGDKPYKCKHPGCEKAFSQLSNLQSHSRCHQTDKPYKCNSCYKCFNEEQLLLDHIPKHKETKHQKIHICPYCGKSYSQSTYLAKHMSKHSDRLDRDSKMREMDLESSVAAAGMQGWGRTDGWPTMTDPTSPDPAGHFGAFNQLPHNMSQGAHAAAYGAVAMRGATAMGAAGGMQHGDPSGAFSGLARLAANNAFAARLGATASGNTKGAYAFPFATDQFKSPTGHDAANHSAGSSGYANQLIRLEDIQQFSRTHGGGTGGGADRFGGMFHHVAGMPIAK